MWTIFGCSKGTGPLDTSSDFEPRVVLADAGVVLGMDATSGVLDGWQVDGKSVRRLTPVGEGTFVAGASQGDGLVAVSANKNGSAPKLWRWDGSEWSAPAALSHGPIYQLLVASDGSLWTEGDAGVHRSTDGGESWTPMAIGANLQLGAIKLGHAQGRIVFAGTQLHVTDDGGLSWKVLYDGPVSTTDGTWVAAQTSRPSLRVGRITDDQLVWTGEVDGRWNASSIRGHAGGVRVVATKSLSTDVAVFESDADGSKFKKTRIRGRASWVGLGERVLRVDDRKRVHISP